MTITQQIITIMAVVLGTILYMALVQMVFETIQLCCKLFVGWSDTKKGRRCVMLKILIAEDEEPIANLIRVNLTRAGYECTCACDGEEAADQMENGHFDLLLLDIMLPKINGYELMEYAKTLQLPVIFITAMGTTEHKVKGLKMGAEDYISKPFEIVELLARVETVMRRYNKIGKTIRILDVEIDLSSRVVTQNGKQVLLPLKEYELLLFFARNPNIALYREVI